MIEQVGVYVVVCECGEKLDTHGDGGYTVFDERKDAVEAIKNEEWELADDKVLCGHCVDAREKK